CPNGDRDHDGIPDQSDKCPDQAEDKDGYQDEDGCPDPDDDGDGVTDSLDACPRVPGEPATDPKRNGCPNPDRDGDTVENTEDQCPDQAEVFNGVKDEDGCPDTGGKALVTITGKDNAIRLVSPVKVVTTPGTVVVDEKTWPQLRALVLELNRHRDWTLAVAAKPDAKAGANDQAALARTVAVVNAANKLAHRDVAEAVGWDAVKQQPSAASGIGLAILVAPVVPVATAPDTRK
ncbi:MAG: thrombospondin type 3 repeat-containing protein, partial [Polyangiaceae bacterium]